MKTRMLVLSILIPLMLFVHSCNFPGSASEPSINDQAATLVAQTLNAPTPTKPVETAQATRPANTATRPASSPTATITLTYSVPMLKVTESTNCRSGPGQSYEILFTLLPGATAEITGKAPTDNYWLIKLPDGSRTCWLWGEFVTVSGSSWAVPTVNPPPTSTASPPAQPRDVNYNYFCNDTGLVDVSFTWEDLAGDEMGYYIYRNNEKITELAANSTAFSDSYSVTSPTEKISYAVSAYNNAGESGRSSFTFSCQ